MLITASSGGIALVERATGNALFYAAAPNTHSAELLPGNRIAVAVSHVPTGEGDRLRIYDLDKPEKHVFETELTWGHGVVWDQSRKILWALSGDDLRAYTLQAWDSANPTLAKVASYKLPDTGGHDLYPVPRSAFLTVTTGRHCWYFDRGSREFKFHPVIGAKEHVKCVNRNPETGQTVYVQAEGRNWWAQTLHFLDPGRTLKLPGEHVYKARWTNFIQGAR